ncbi:MAG TPA: hypothetical protein VMU09_08465, partial [Acidimicrobiales bacterium]|nr:hypothetical protein [Acidimicrobiales bacterium]
MTQLAGRAAWADELSIYLNPGYQGAWTTTTDASGTTHQTNTESVLQQYRASLIHPFFTNLRLNAGGIFDDAYAWPVEDGHHTTTDLRQWSYFGNLALNTQVLTTSLGYDHRTQSQSATGSTTQNLQSDVASFVASYRPGDLPWLTLRLAHTLNYDDNHTIQDTTVDEAQLGAGYRPVSSVNLQYGLRVASTDDHLADVRSTSVANNFQAAYSDMLFGQRTLVAAGVNAGATTTDVTVGGTGGLVATQQIPIAGLSHLEVFPDVATKDTLEETRALVDGDLTASAGLSIGYGPTEAGDTRPRDVGVRMADTVTTVSTFYVWVDRTLPQDLAAHFSWQAYSSDDNITWSPVALQPAPGQTVPVVFGAFQNRFEITLSPTAARYLKVVTTPLAAGV